MSKLYIIAIILIVVVVIIMANGNDSSSTKGRNPVRHMPIEKNRPSERDRCGPPLTEGNYTNEPGKEWMLVDNGVVRIGRDRASFSVLPNKTNVKLFDKDDLSSAHPQYLQYIDENTAEWVRKASGPNPQYKIIFHRKQ